MVLSPQITVSSGGMLTQKLNVDDLQFEKGTFDGTMAYAQNKVRQIKLQQLLGNILIKTDRHHVCNFYCSIYVFVFVDRDSR